MSKQVKELLSRDLQNRLEGVDSVAVLNPRGITATQTNNLRRKLHENNLRMTVVRNNLVRRVINQTDSPLKGVEALLDGPTAMVYGEASISQIARILLEQKKENEALELRGVFFDGDVFPGEEGVEKVSKMPTREEAIGNILGAILGPGRKLAAALKGPGGTVGAVLKSIQEKQESGGEAAPAA